MDYHPNSQNPRPSTTLSRVEPNYPAPGSPQLATRIADLLSNSPIAHHLNPTRGFDHGVFVPFLLMYPQADIPIVQVSLDSNLDPEFHLRLGQALSPLRDEGVLIIGTGMSYHNMARFGTEQATRDSALFDEWLTGVCSADPARRHRSLARWAGAPAARASHPREEHLLPLMVVVGAAGEDPGSRIFTDEVMGARVSAYAFGKPAGVGTGS